MTHPDITQLEKTQTTQEYVREQERLGERRRWGEENTLTGFEMERQMLWMNRVENGIEDDDTEEGEQMEIDDFGGSRLVADGGRDAVKFAREVDYVEYDGEGYMVYGAAARDTLEICQVNRRPVMVPVDECTPTDVMGNPLEEDEDADARLMTDGGEPADNEVMSADEIKESVENVDITGSGSLCGDSDDGDDVVNDDAGEDTHGRDDRLSEQYRRGHAVRNQYSIEDVNGSDVVFHDSEMLGERELGILRRLDDLADEIMATHDPVVERNSRKEYVRLAQNLGSESENDSNTKDGQELMSDGGTDIECGEPIIVNGEPIGRIDGIRPRESILIEELDGYPDKIEYRPRRVVVDVDNTLDWSNYTAPLTGDVSSTFSGPNPKLVEKDEFPTGALGRCDCGILCIDTRRIPSPTYNPPPMCGDEGECAGCGR